jgi:hypothetical protein
MLTPSRRQCAWTCVPLSPTRVESRRGALRAMHSPAGAAVGGSRLAASSGARRSGAWSQRSPVAPPCTRSSTTTSGWPVCAAVGGLVSVAAETPSPPDCPRLVLGCQAMFRPPVGSVTRSRGRCALPPLAAPQGAWRKAPAPLRSARAVDSSRPSSPTRVLPIAALTSRTAAAGWQPPGASRRCQAGIGAGGPRSQALCVQGDRRRTLVPDEARAWAGVQRGGSVPPHPSPVAALRCRSNGLLLPGCVLPGTGGGRVLLPLTASHGSGDHGGGRPLAAARGCRFLRRFFFLLKTRNVILAGPRQGQASLRSVRTRTLDTVS